MAKGKRGGKKQAVPREYLVKLRNALVDEMGRDKDVSKDIPAFMAYNRNGMDCKITFTNKLDHTTASWAQSLCKRNMEALYDDSGYGWCDLDKKDELVGHGGAARFLVVREKSDQQRLVGFVHFRFTLQGEAVGVQGGEPTLYIMDIQIEPFAQRKGLGRHLVRSLEMIGRKQEMMHLMMPVVIKNEDAKSFVQQGLNGWTVDDLSSVMSADGQDAASILKEDGTFIILAKALKPTPAAPVAAESSPVKPSQPSSDHLSAANTPEKSAPSSADPNPVVDVAASAPTEDVAARAGNSNATIVPTFDPTFGQAPANTCPTAHALAEECVAAGAVPEGLGDAAENVLQELIAMFKANQGRDPTQEEIAKWMATIREAAEEEQEEEGDGDSDEEEEDDDEDDEESEEDESA